ncbi:50S ribosomal protein L33 [Pullulanibacillus sp. KACC 23026]|nr:50S ribosomal protein L33 [Pullulanibacillus sp. KACC 23026]WEG12688.1 50S ribosomal protein L33 [Pullulanibacillus sp. KACC 23026]
MAEKLSLECEVCKQRNYTTFKTKDTASVRVELRKFCQRCNRHTIHRETK